MTDIQPAKGSGELPVVTLENDQKIMPKLIVGSDGGFSMTRSKYGIDTTGHGYGQKGLVCSV